MRDLCRDAQDIFLTGVAAVRGDALMREYAELDADSLSLGELRVGRDSFDRIVLVGAGKASAAMAIGLATKIRADEVGSFSDRKIQWVGHVNVPAGCEHIPENNAASPDSLWPNEVILFPARPQGVNEPTAAAIAGTDRIIELVRQAGPRDLVIVLVSGGGSALLCRPIAGISLDEKLAVIRHLSGSGADITELNTVRKHLSAVKGGGLARACRTAPMITLILSDVLGDPLDLIASGPTVPDSSTSDEALQILTRSDPNRELPATVYDSLESTHRSGDEALDDSTGDVAAVSSTVVLGNNAVAVDAAGIRAESLGYNHVMHVARQSEGTAEKVGERLAEMTFAMLRRDKTQHRQDALITGGEPVVRLVAASHRGRGGRNQQLVLAAYRRLRQLELTNEQWQRLTILSGGTDGEDGPTDAAGAWIDGQVHQRACELKLDVESYLGRNDAYTFFQQTGGLLITGPTGTNVCDVRVALVDSSDDAVGLSACPAEA